MRAVAVLFPLFLGALASISPLWSVPAGGQQNYGKCSVIESGVVYIPGVSRGSFKAISTIDGKVLWNNKGPSATATEDHCFTVISAGDHIIHIYYRTSDFTLEKSVNVYKKADGRVLWKSDLKFNSVSWSSDYLLAVSHDTTVSLQTTVKSYGLRDGKLANTYAIPNSKVAKNATDDDIVTRFYPKESLFIIFVHQYKMYGVPTLYAINWTQNATSVFWTKPLPYSDDFVEKLVVLDNESIFVKNDSISQTYLTYSINDINTRLSTLTDYISPSQWHNKPASLLTKDPDFAVETLISWFNETLLNTTWIVHSLTPGQDSKVVSVLTLEVKPELTTFAVSKPDEIFVFDSSTHTLHIGDVHKGWLSEVTLAGLPKNTVYNGQFTYTNTRVLGASKDLFIVQGYEIVPNHRKIYVVKDPKVYAFSRK